MEPWAKDNGQTLSEHVAKCLEVARAIVPTLPLPDEEKRALEEEVIIALALHDAGKSAKGFQKVMHHEEKDWGGRRHEILSASLASSIPSVSEAVIFAILTHHRSIPNTHLNQEKRALDIDSIPLDDESEQSVAWKKMKKEWIENYSSFQESWIKICQMINRPDLASAKDLPKVRLDRSWLRRGGGSGSQLRSKMFKERRHFSIVRGLLMTSDHLASGGYIPKNVQRFCIQDCLNSSLDATIRRNIRGFQVRMSEKRDSVILRAPTGSGKTEAALLWAGTNERRYSRLFYVLPNIASINAMFERLVRLFGSDNVGLLHSRAREAIYKKIDNGDDLESKLHSEKNARMLASVAKSIWFPVRVCTPHQILRFSLRGRGWETSLAEFPNSLFVFDEIHAYDPRLVGQILATARLVKCWGAKCAFLSATMPSFLIDLIKENTAEGRNGTAAPELIVPQIREDKELIEKKRHVIHMELGTLLDCLQSIISDMENGLKVLVVCNTVRASQQVFSELCNALRKKYSQEALTQKIILLIHSRFTRRDRSAKELRLLNLETQPRILVATQVVEVSLDISYDTAYLEPAPIDAIVQRMGRVNRKGENPTPATIHLADQEISSRSVYRKGERIKRTIEQFSDLSRRQVPLSEVDLVAAADMVYDGGYDAEELFKFGEGINNSELRNFEEEMITGASEDWKENVLDDAWGIDILPRLYLSDFESCFEKRLFIEAYSYLVPVQYKTKIFEERDLSHDPPISHYEYSPLSGFSVQVEDDPWNDDLSDKAPSDPSNII